MSGISNAANSLPPLSSSALGLTSNQVADEFENGNPSIMLNEQGDSIGASGLAKRIEREVPTVAKTLSDKIFSVGYDDLNDDPVVSAMGGAYIVEEGNITLQKHIPNLADTPLLPVGYYSDTNQEATSDISERLVIQAIDPGVDIRPVVGNSYEHTAYEIPVSPASTADCKYNFYISEYEQFLDNQQNQSDKELQMLDVYGTVLSVGNKLNSASVRTDGAGTPISRNFTMDDGYSYRNQPKDGLVKYFKDYSILPPPPDMKYKNVIFPEENVGDANSVFAASKDSFPFYVSFNIGLAPNGEVGETMIDSSYADSFVTSLASTVESNSQFERTRFLRQYFDSVRYADPRVYNFGRVLAYQDTSFEEKSVLLGTRSQYLQAYKWVQPTFAQNLEALDLLVNVQDTTFKNVLSLRQVANGDKNYSEVLAYRIAKFRGDDLDTPIQNFYFFNTNKSAVFNFMDSQVLPGQSYKYKVYAYSFVCNTKYMYEDAVLRDPFFVLTTRLSSESKIIEDMIYETDAYVTSLPPVSPDVSFRSFFGNERKIQVTFQKSQQRRVEMPVSFNSEETERIENIRKSQGVLGDSPITFSNDDDAVVYEVYRTTKKPQSASSFSDKLWRRVVDTEIIERVVPDTTYYYAFRSIDNHGNPSNPSPPYEVTLVGGVSPYLIVNPYRYPAVAVEKRERTKSFKKFLRVAPALQQLMLDGEGVSDKGTSLNVKAASLGVSQQGKIWGKKYKIRITSKETGKKIDFNLEYDYNFEHREQ
tara:strand:+ start:6846 stop:9122 length:2277 start_codon:yes stop_codon:yes gene_type:complete